MSFAFSRRSFLKYTAVAAVAVAGASLFTGCKIDTSDSYNALRTTPGELTVLQVVRLKSALDIGQLNHAEVTVFLKWRIGMAVQGLAEHHALRHPRPA